MRYLKEKEQKKRGCSCCLDAVMKKSYYGFVSRHCPFDECPYHELDEYDTYREYLKHNKVDLGDLLGFKVKNKEKG